MRSFWKFEAHVKWDQLKEHVHLNLICGAMRDPETGIERISRTSVIFFGQEEALLFEPRSALFRVAVRLYEGLHSIIRHN